MITTFKKGILQNYALSNAFWNSFCTWNMIMCTCMIFFYGIDQKVKFVMTPFSLHLASMMQLGMRSNNPRHRGNLCWAPPCLSLALGWLVAHSSRSTNLGIMLHTKFGSMGIRRSTQCTTLYVVHSSKFVHLPKFWIFNILPWCRHIALILITFELV
jgi:hypothetical protein